MFISMFRKIKEKYFMCVDECCFNFLLLVLSMCLIVLFLPSVFSFWTLTYTPFLARLQIYSLSFQLLLLENMNLKAYVSPCISYSVHVMLLVRMVIVRAGCIALPWRASPLHSHFPHLPVILGESTTVHDGIFLIWYGTCILMILVPICVVMFLCLWSLINMTTYDFFKV